jgi:hypothetical protein
MNHSILPGGTRDVAATMSKHNERSASPNQVHSYTVLSYDLQEPCSGLESLASDGITALIMLPSGMCIVAYGGDGNRGIVLIAFIPRQAVVQSGIHCLSLIFTIKLRLWGVYPLQR